MAPQIGRGEERREHENKLGTMLARRKHCNPLVNIIS